MGFVQGKTVVITGASSGIGLETALALGQRGARVVMVSRDPQRGQSAYEVVREAAKRAGSPAPELILADLSVKTGIETVVSRVQTDFGAVQVLVNNAGGYFAHRRETEEGFEYTMALNHIAPARLTMALIELLQRNAPARVINVSSHAHSFGPLDLSDLQMSGQAYAGFKQYGRAKTASLLWTRAAARKLSTTEVTLNAVHPGWIKTSFGASNQGSLTAAAFRALSAVLARRQSAGAVGPVFLADDEGLQTTTGVYFRRERRAEPAQHARDPALEEAVWNWTAGIL